MMRATRAMMTEEVCSPVGAERAEAAAGANLAVGVEVVAVVTVDQGAGAAVVVEAVAVAVEAVAAVVVAVAAAQVAVVGVAAEEAAAVRVRGRSRGRRTRQRSLGRPADRGQTVIDREQGWNVNQSDDFILDNSLENRFLLTLCMKSPRAGLVLRMVLVVVLREIRVGLRPVAKYLCFS